MKVADHQGFKINEFFDEMADYIDLSIEVGSGVLVHCNGTYTRSGIFAVVFLVKYRGFKLSEAISLVKSKIPSFKLKKYFNYQLKDYYRKLKKMVASQKLKEVEEQHEKQGKGLYFSEIETCKINKNDQNDGPSRYNHTFSPSPVSKDYRETTKYDYTPSSINRNRSYERRDFNELEDEYNRDYQKRSRSRVYYESPISRKEKPYTDYQNEYS